MAENKKTNEKLRFFCHFFDLGIHSIQKKLHPHLKFLELLVMALSFAWSKIVKQIPSSCL